MYYQLVKKTSLTNSALEFLGQKNWELPSYTTWANPNNTYEHKEKYEPQIYDHIFRKVNAPHNVKVRTVGFDVQLLKTRCPTAMVEPTNECPNVTTTLINLSVTECSNNPFSRSSKESDNTQLDFIDQTLRSECSGQEMISLSDHEAITATLRIKKNKTGNFCKKYYDFVCLAKILI